MGGYGVINRVIKTGLMIPYRLPHDLAISDVKATFLRILFFNSCDWHSICRLVRLGIYIDILLLPKIYF